MRQRSQGPSGRESRDHEVRQQALGSPLGSWLLGSADQPASVLRVRLHLLLISLNLLSNLVGIAVAVTLVILVIPGPSVFAPELVLWHTVALPAYVAVSLVLGPVWGRRRTVRTLAWVFDGSVPTQRQRKATLRMPMRLVRVQAVLWFGALVLFTTVHALLLPGSAFKVGFTVAISAMVVCANSYLFSEFALRPVAARALSSGPPPKRKLVAGMTVRQLLGWGLGSGLPVVGLMLVAVFALVRDDVSSTQLSVTILVLGSVILVFGQLLMWLTARATSAPVRTVRQALARVERGRLDTEVAVFDGTELGLLQAGFNRMVGGLRERDRIRDLFGRHVGEEVAAEALARRPELGGEVCEVAVLFVDLVGSTTLAATRPPAEVVGLLNRFFAVVVDEVDRHGGMVNKFAGDAVLAVFGAPVRRADAPGQALATARAVARRLRAEVPDCEAGIGVAAGQAVAGNVGHESRFEYTVIGDPVNEAARLTELAKSVPGGVVASMVAVEAASNGEAGRWREHDETTLRGRTEITRVAVPES
ncbi:adenylate/guanylate cyclase domain-containing protein [Amycolatopsis suaedae]|uniref:adenylate/guanylate cyclase domain-containing protein n=1 Tax=Amycolatopsis suaedae TaxID=2510978 RepID=UPI001F10408E|nr:adenylate/guanylate cyclase domain-containing protein [Amycolatopsis suaedae]